ncbi:MAG TPA: AI-2E family transporter [Xanthobacteraceae bacterium]|nr:AI-2E family transporter [Xanthobacteraceae bacterium]
MTSESDTLSKHPKQLAWSIGVGGCAIVAFGALLALIWYSAATLLLIFAGILFGVFLNALTVLLGRLIGGGQALRLTLVCLFLTALFAGAIGLGGATIAQQAKALSTTIKTQVGNVKSYLDERGIDTNIFNLDAFTATDQAAKPGDGNGSAESHARTPSRGALPSAGAIASGTGTIVGHTIRILIEIFGAMTNIFIIIFIGLLLAAQPKVYTRGFLSFFTPRYRAKAAEVYNDIGETLRRWILGQIVTMSVIFVVTWVGLSVIGIPGALVLGFQAGLLTFIPTVGAVIAGVIILLASLGSGWTALLSAFGLYLLVQTLEGNILTPLIQRHAIDIPPATLFMAQIFLGVIFGLWGLALALPLIAVLKVTLRHVYGDEKVPARA